MSTTILLIIAAICTAVTAVCVAFDSYEGVGTNGRGKVLFMLKHASTLVICRVCAFAAFVLSIAIAFCFPIGNVENELLWLIAKLFVWLLTFSGELALFVLIGGIITCFIKR